MAHKKYISLFLICALLIPATLLAEGVWINIKDKHFVVYYNYEQDTSAAATVLRKSEDYYRTIADQVGYSRYANFWTWDDRVKIIIFPNQKIFMENTGQPQWSRGFSDRDSALFKSRIIVTYRQEESFLGGVLPHEVGHLILRDFIGFETRVPLWFEEGVAQLQEESVRERANQYLHMTVKNGQFIPFKIFMTWDIRKEGDSKKVSLFYLQAISVIDFLIRNYGSSNFGYLCRSLKDGKTFEEALRAAYTATMNSTDDLERRWVDYMKR